MIPFSWDKTIPGNMVKYIILWLYFIYFRILRALCAFLSLPSPIHADCHFLLKFSFLCLQDHPNGILGRWICLDKSHNTIKSKILKCHLRKQRWPWQLSKKKKKKVFSNFFFVALYSQSKTDQRLFETFFCQIIASIWKIMKSVTWGTLYIIQVFYDTSVSHCTLFLITHVRFWLLKYIVI